MILQVEIYENFREVKQNQKLFYVIRKKAKPALGMGKSGFAMVKRTHISKVLCFLPFPPENPGQGAPGEDR